MNKQNIGQALGAAAQGGLAGLTMGALGSLTPGGTPETPVSGVATASASATPPPTTTAPAGIGAGAGATTGAVVSAGNPNFTGLINNSQAAPSANIYGNMLNSPSIAPAPTMANNVMGMGAVPPWGSGVPGLGQLQPNLYQNFQRGGMQRGYSNIG